MKKQSHCPLSLKIKGEYQVLGFDPDIGVAFRQTLIALGFMPGASFRIARAAPFGDPLQIETARSNLMLRKQDLAWLKLAPITGE